ncbi:MAG: hypothetical protein ABWX74_07725 [Aeromicrobium sp.]
MWVLLDDGWMEYDWAAGTTRMVPGTEGAILAAAHGRLLAATDLTADGVSRDWQVRDLTSGAGLRDVRIGADNPSPSISPVGRFVRVQSHYAGVDDKGVVVDPPVSGTGAVKLGGNSYES